MTARNFIERERKKQNKKKFVFFNVIFDINYTHVDNRGRARQTNFVGGKT